MFSTLASAQPNDVNSFEVREIVPGPSPFPGGLTLHNVHFSADGREFCFHDRKAGQVKESVPEGGMFRLGGELFQVQRQLEGILVTAKREKKRFGGILGTESYASVSSSQQGMDLSLNKVSLFGGGISFNLGHDDDEIFHTFRRDEVRKVTARSEQDEIALLIADNVVVEGSGEKQPVLESEHLNLPEFTGIVFVPRGVEIDIKAGDGITGEVAGPGTLKSEFGGIEISLCAPLIVQITGESEAVQIEGMTRDGKGRWIPADGEVPRGVLNIETAGPIEIYYGTKVEDDDLDDEEF